jgi:plastocyanin
MTDQERQDQQRFDEAVARKGKVVLQALAGLGILAAVLMSMVALVNSGEKHETTVSAKPATQAAAAVPAAKTAAASAPATKTVSLKIIPEYKKGPDGQKHDAFTVTDFNVKVGQPLKLAIDNTDTAPHSITAPLAGVNVIVQPGVHTYTLTVQKAGKFQWNCMLPCDDWAMQNVGFMGGYITAT